MDYEEILRKIEQDKKDRFTVDLYRYQCLMQAIEYFSNRLGFDQIVHAAFECANELLTVSRSVLFVLADNHYILKGSKGQKTKITQMQPNSILKTFAVLYGDVVYGREKLMEYFSPELLDHYQAHIMIPLITDTTLTGFILLSEKTTVPFDTNDMIICRTLMRLFMNALENSKRLEKLQHANQELDKKIFSLFAINQSSKILLTEHDLKTLYTLSLDVFSELTLSSRTGFFLYDEGAEKFVLRAYKDIYQTVFSWESICFTQNADAMDDPGRFIIDIHDPTDVDYFHQLFQENIHTLDPLNPLYIILLIKDTKVLGFVSLSDTVSGIPYKANVFELVESLASYTYIALSNAILLKKVKQQKELLQKKLNRMISLNRLMKNINSAEDLETLQRLIIKTIEVSFGVEKGALALYRQESNTLMVVSQTGISSEDLEIKLNKYWDRLYKGSIVLETDEDELPRYLGDKMSNVIGSNSGLLAIPIYLEKYELLLLGALVIFSFREGLLSDEENMVVMESISNLSAPILKNFIQIEKERKALTENYKELFCRELQRQAKECKQLDSPLRIIHIEREIGLFEYDDLLHILNREFENVFPVSYNHIMILVIKDFQYYSYRITEVGEKYKAKIVIYEMGKDFNDYHDFVKLFHQSQTRKG